MKSDAQEVIDPICIDISILRCLVLGRLSEDIGQDRLRKLIDSIFKQIPAGPASGAALESWLRAAERASEPNQPKLSKV